MISICICDDNTVSLAHVKTLLMRFQEENEISLSVKAYTNGKDLVTSLASGEFFHIYLLNMVMPGENGIELAREIRQSDENAGIIFQAVTTDLAYEAFSVAATDYLLKPLSYEALSRALFRVLKPHKDILDEDKLSIRSMGSIQSISLDNICYIEVRKNKLNYVLNGGKEIEEYRTLANLQDDLLHHNEFIKVHRSYLINMKYIREIIPGEVILAPEHHLPVSRSYAAALKRSYLAYTATR